MIAAIASGNRALGKDGDLIYKIPDDLKRFREITSGHAIIMGRKTYEAIGRPLPNRKNIIITRNPDLKVEGCIVVNSLNEALEKAEEDNEIFIIGGGEIFKQAFLIADKLYLTIIEGNPEADAYFPDYPEFKKVVFEQDHEWNGLKYKYIDLER
ncbi:dihydrofolate reductase [Candidatus Daviesbacteria bacterium]|nr:dihydrofolate reductase [Candidatus Daviesbacteria bacterium]